MREGSKATERRLNETCTAVALKRGAIDIRPNLPVDGSGKFYCHPYAVPGFDWNCVFRGRMLDMGPGDDLLVWPSETPLSDDEGARWNKAEGFDKAGVPDGAGYVKSSQELGYHVGDANRIADYFDPETFDCIHASQVFEHLYHCVEVMKQCLTLLKPGGHLVITVPDFDLYEGGVFPSRYNPDHKHTWSLWRRAAPTSYPHVYVPDIRKQLGSNRMIMARLVDTNYDYLGTGDQTFDFEKRVECFIEIVIQKA